MQRSLLRDMKSESNRQLGAGCVGVGVWEWSSVQTIYSPSTDPKQDFHETAVRDF